MQDIINKNKKKIIGAIMGTALAIVGAIFGVDVSDQKDSITNQVEAAVDAKMISELGGLKSE